jgi:membrane protein insertase Oxa1/YidC/SpoIIIJ
MNKSIITVASVLFMASVSFGMLGFHYYMGGYEVFWLPILAIVTMFLGCWMMSEN